MNVIPTQEQRDRLRAEWQRSRFPMPNKLFVIYKDLVYIVLDDSRNIIRLIGRNGDIHAAYKIKCDDNGQDYVCGKVVMILCSASKGPDNARDKFGNDNLVRIIAK